MATYSESIRKHTFKHAKPVSLYIVFGLSALALELTTFFIAIELFNMGILIANAIAIGCGMLLSFGLNAVLNFKVVNNLVARFFSYVAVVGIGYIVSSILLVVLIASDVSSLYAKLATLPVVFALQYSLNQRFAFRR